MNRSEPGVATAAPTMHQIGPWLFDSRSAALRQGNLENPLEDRAARVLTILCQRRGEVVSKAELLDKVWHGRAVSPNSVAIVIGDLRRALTEEPGDPVHLLTVGKRGYRLAAVPPVPEPAKPRRPRWRAIVTLGIMLAIGVTAIGLYNWNAPPPELVVLATTNETGERRYDALSRSMSGVLINAAAHLPAVSVLTPPLPHETSGTRMLLRSRLVIWNGEAEVAITITDAASRKVIWSGFASGRTGNMAQEASSRLRTFGTVLEHTGHRRAGAFFIRS